jgi:LytS/YehU family sensor histidine kinase
LSFASSTHVYETVYLIQQRESDILRFEKLERAKAEAELAALKTQIDPHFMFNSLNALAFLIEHDSSKALQFNNDLAGVYRYILLNRSEELVSLRDEIEFLNHYYALLKLRFGDAIQLCLPKTEQLLDEYVIPPISLQVLLENAVKHNQFSEEQPLQVRIWVDNGAIAVCNEIRTRNAPRDSANIGLKNLNERYQLIMQRGIRIENSGSTFTVILPLLKTSQ